MSIALAFAHSCRFSDVYVADLDAIAGADPDWNAYEQIANCGLHLMLDPGIRSADRAVQIAEFARRTGHRMTAVVGSEAIRDSQQLREVIETQPPNQAVFSLDLRDGRPIVANPKWSEAGPMSIVADVVAAGLRRFIILDLKAVGTGGGPATLELCRQVRERYPDIELISGGGVRNLQDVKKLCDAGCDQVLVASALHDGRIGKRGQEDYGQEG